MKMKSGFSPDSSKTSLSIFNFWIVKSLWIKIATDGRGFYGFKEVPLLNLLFQIRFSNLLE
jgi:hypothetical protein